MHNKCEYGTIDGLATNFYHQKLTTEILKDSRRLVGKTQRKLVP